LKPHENGVFLFTNAMDINELYNIFLSCNSKVCTDTRNIISGSLFIALKGDNFNGNKFALEALKNGCSYAIIDEGNYNNKKIIKVDNSLKTLQQLAKFHRLKFDIPVVSITGTNGKTTTKELVSVVLQKKYKITYTLGNLNNHIGVPLTLLEISKETEIAIIEMGANHPGEIKELCEISCPDYGLITNVGVAHLEGFGSFEGVVNTKTEMYRFIKERKGVLFVNINNDILFNNIQGVLKITYGASKESNIIGKEPVSNPFLELDWKVNNNPEWIHLKTNLVGSYNFENVLAAICIGNYFKLDSDDINESINGYSPSNNRSQILKANKNTLLIDAYNANPTSMAIALDNFIQMKGDRKVMIIGDMLELGNNSIKEHKIIIDKVKESGISNIYFVGKSFHSLSVQYGLCAFLNVDEMKKYLKENPISENLILIKGSHGIHLEKLVEIL
jgi:UDP-N-acetylmuramoyl-tripeptide--D-alanyl-D-alanine ligase